MNERYQQIYEDENGNEIPHFDLAENIDYDNSESGLDSSNVQGAIDQLSSISRVKILEQCEVTVTENNETRIIDYESLHVSEEIPQFNFPECTIREYIFKGYDAEVDWSDSANDSDNPATWNATNITKYYKVANTGWAKLISLRPSTNKAYVYVSYRTRSVYDTNFAGGFSTPVIATEILQDTEHTKYLFDPGVSSNYDSVKEAFNEDVYNKTVLERAKDTRLFLQGVFDSVTKDETVVFPKNKVFIIDFDKQGYRDSFMDVRNTYKDNLSLMETSSGVVDASWYKVCFIGLIITRKINIDLNGSKIILIPNWLYNHRVLAITGGIYYYAANVPTDGRNPAGTVIKNGSILGGTKFYFPDANGYTDGKNYEDADCLAADVTVTLENLEIGNVSGSGAILSSKRNGTVCNLVSRVLQSNGTTSTNNVGNYKTTSFVSIASLIKQHYYSVFNIVARPYIYKTGTTTGYNTLIDIAPFYVNENIWIAYYSSEDEESYISGSFEKIRLGDNFHIPEGATHVKCMVEFDINNSYDTSVSSSLTMKLYLFAVRWASSVKVTNCEIHDCFRDGITLGSMPGGIVKDVRIKNCDQHYMNVESVAYLDDGLIFENVTLDESGRGVSVSTGSHLMIRDSKMSVVQIPGPQASIQDSDINTLRTGPLATGKTIRTFNSNISRPRRVVRDTIIREETHGVATLYENCIFSGKFTVIDQSAHSSDYLNVFKNCTIKTSNIGPGIYENCIFRNTEEIALEVFYQATSLQSRYIFKNCDINCASMVRTRSTMTGTSRYNNGPLIVMEDCKVVFTNHVEVSEVSHIYVPHFYGCFIERFVGNDIKFAPLTSVQRQDTQYEFLVKPYNNTIIERNVFTAADETTKINLIRLEINSVEKHYNNFVEIIKNNVAVYKNTVANNNNFVVVVAMDATSDATISVDKNTFRCLSQSDGDATNVLTKINASGVTNNTLSLSSSNSKAINAADPVEYNIN